MSFDVFSISGPIVLSIKALLNHGYANGYKGLTENIISILATTLFIITMYIFFINSPQAIIGDNTTKTEGGYWE